MNQSRETGAPQLKGCRPEVLLLDQLDPSTTRADAILPSHEGAADPIGREAIAFAVRTLRRQQMPLKEISAVIDADDPKLVRRHLALHREWLEERLADELRTLAGVERFLVRALVSLRESPPDRLSACRS